MPTRHRGPAVVIRPYRPVDQPQLRAFHDRTPPDGTTSTAGTQAWLPDLDHVTETYLRAGIRAAPASARRAAATPAGRT